MATFAGQTLTVLDPNISNPYSLRWNFGFQQQLGANTVLEVVYLGNHSVHLPIYAVQLNSIPRQYLSTLPTRDQTIINTLTATVPNPFAGVITSGSLSGATTTVAQLLVAYPQYPTGTGSESSGVLLDNDSIGSSYFESINVHITKRFVERPELIGNYIHSKLIERDSFLNDTDPAPEKRISSFDHPNRFVAAFTYELPIGRQASDFGRLGERDCGRVDAERHLHLPNRPAADLRQRQHDHRRATISTTAVRCI